MPVILTPDEMANATQGRWENLSDDLKIEEVEYLFHYLKKGDLFVVRKATCKKVDAAKQKGVSALLASYDCHFKTDLPVLRVENTYKALRAIALASREKTTLKSVLVTGSYGKTGFKNHLHTVIKEMFNTYARRSSANRIRSTYCNLASLKPEHELLIIEQPITDPSKVARRAAYVRPDICVLTSIGHEHIEHFGTVEKIIETKTKIAKSLKPGGKFLIPRDDPYYKQIKKALAAYDQIDLLTFGSRSSCNARVLYQKYRDFGWDVIAKIEELTVAYHIPFPEVHEPIASLAVLLCVYHLGGDVYKAAARFHTCDNFKSSGTFLRATYKETPFFLYDQSHRGGMEGYAQFFKTLRHLQPKGNGRKVVVTSAFVDDADGEIEMLDIPSLRSLMSEAGIDLLYSVEKFKLHKHVVPDNIVWQMHADVPVSLCSHLLSIIQENDILCIKGIFESTLPELVRCIKKHRDIHIEALEHHDTMQQQWHALQGLKPINFSDKSRFMDAAQRAQKNNWISFFPFLLFWSFSPKRELFIETFEGSVCIYLFRRFGQQKPPSLQLLMPPMPLCKPALEHGYRRLFAMRGKDFGTILWVDEDEKTLLADVTPDHIQVELNPRGVDEFLFEPSRYQDLSGKAFRHLRQNLYQMDKYENLHIEPYSQKYYQPCIALLEKWESVQGEKYDHLEDISYTRHCLKFSDRFEDEVLFGIVVLINNSVAAFGFAGKIREDVGSLFIGKHDPDIKGAFDYMKFHLLLKMQAYKYVNDSYALSEGMAFSKRMFRPVRMLAQYSAKIKKDSHEDAIDLIS